MMGWFLAVLAVALRGSKVKLAHAHAGTADESESSRFCDAALQGWFGLMDADHSGGVSQAELSAFLQTRTAIRSMLRSVTESGDDQEVLSKLDADKSGSVEQPELRQYLAQLGFVETGSSSHSHAEGSGDVMEEVHRILKSKMKEFPGVHSVEDILNWDKEIAGPYLGAPGRDPVLPDRARVMSIHDMAGGYARNPDNLYLSLFQSWDAVDVFVYFSHLRLAVPPQPWIVEAHNHGSVALGTIMFEGGDGARAAAEVQQNQEAFIDKVAEITEHYGFDGWLVNVEAWSGGSPTRFVKALTKKMREVLGKRSQIVAYPYTPAEDMFGACDGVYVNYGWDPSDGAMEEVKREASGRQHDVYMGLDAFGSRRGNPTPDDYHVADCAKHDLSVAVFAPGYTFEVEADKKYSQEAEQTDLKFWSDVKTSFGIDRRQELASFPAFHAETTGTPTASGRIVPSEQQQAGKEAQLQDAISEATMWKQEAAKEHELAQQKDAALAAAQAELVRTKKRPQATLAADGDAQARVEQAESTAAAARTDARSMQAQLEEARKAQASWSLQQHQAGVAAACAFGLMLFFAGRYSSRKEGK